MSDTPLTDRILTYDAPHDHNEAGSSLSDLLGMLWRRKWLFAAIVVLGELIAVLLIIMTTAQYTAEGLVLITGKHAEVVDLRPVLASADPNPFLLESQMESEIEIMRSFPLISKVVVKLGLMRDPELNPALAAQLAARAAATAPPGPGTAIEKELTSGFMIAWEAARHQYCALLPCETRTVHAPVQVAAPPSPPPSPADVMRNFEARLQVASKGRSTVLTVNYTSADPTKAAAVTNALMQEYVQASQEAKSDATRGAANWLVSRLTQLRKHQYAIEQKIAAFRAGKNILGDGTDSMAAVGIEEIRRNLVQARIDQRLAQQNAARSGDADPAVLASPVIQRLQEQQAELESQMRNELSELGTKHPAVATAHAALARLHSTIQSETAKIHSAKRSEASLADAKVNALQYQLRQAELDNNSHGTADVTLRDMQREANANSSLYEQFLKRYEEVSEELDAPVQADAEIINPARVPEKASYPPKSLFLSASFVISLLIAGCIVFAIDMINPRFRGIEQVERVFQRPALTVIPKLPAIRARHRPENYVLARPASPYGEAIRDLRTSVYLLAGGAHGRSIMFTSAIPDEGKTSTALSFARMAARGGDRVVIVDCDLRRSARRARLGLSDLLAKGEKLESVINVDHESGLHYVCGGSATETAADLLEGPRFRQFLTDLEAAYDLVVLDTPPLLSVGDSRLLAAVAHYTAYVIELDRTSRKDACKGYSLLMQAGANVIGIVISRADLKHTSSRAYGKYARRSSKKSNLLLGT